MGTSDAESHSMTSSTATGRAAVDPDLYGLATIALGLPLAAAPALLQSLLMVVLAAAAIAWSLSGTIQRLSEQRPR